MSDELANRIHGTAKEEKTKLTFSGARPCGSGRFSNVYAAELIEPEKRKIAIKNVWTTEEEKYEASEHPEIQILSKLHHPAINNLLYYYTKSADKNKIHCLVLDFMPSDMAKLRDGGLNFDVLDAKMYSYQLFCSIAYLASEKVVHMDIKPQNILINHEKGLLKLGDFGNARRLDSAEKTGNPYQVTRYYRPPELLFGSRNFSPAIDVWSTACVAFEFFANRTLFKGKNSDDQINLIIEVFGYPTEPDIKSMGVKRPRFAKKKARTFETYTSNKLEGVMYDMFKAAFVYDPKLRKTADDLISMALFDAKPPLQRGTGTPIPNIERFASKEFPKDIEDDEE